MRVAGCGRAVRRGAHPLSLRGHRGRRLAVVFVVWVVAAAVLLALELHTTAFYAVFVALGLGVAAVLDVVAAPLWLQLVALTAVAGLGVAVARPILVRVVERGRQPLVLSGVQNLVGQRALTVDAVGDEHHPGHALLAGERWLAVSADGVPLPPQVEVVVAAVRGTTLVVRAESPKPA